MSPLVIGLALFAAILHASWNAFLPTGADRLWTVTVMSFSSTALAIPLAIFNGFPATSAWPMLRCRPACRSATACFWWPLTDMANWDRSTRSFAAACLCSSPLAASCSPASSSPFWRPSALPWSVAASWVFRSDAEEPPRHRSFMRWQREPSSLPMRRSMRSAFVRRIMSAPTPPGSCWPMAGCCRRLSSPVAAGSLSTRGRRNLEGTGRRPVRAAGLWRRGGGLRARACRSDHRDPRDQRCLRGLHRTAVSRRDADAPAGRRLRRRRARRHLLGLSIVTAMHTPAGTRATAIDNGLLAILAVARA